MTYLRHRANKSDILLAALKRDSLLSREHHQLQGILHFLLLKANKQDLSEKCQQHNTSLKEYVAQLLSTLVHIYFTSLPFLALAVGCCRRATLTSSVPGHCHAHQHKRRLPVLWRSFYLCSPPGTWSGKEWVATTPVLQAVVLGCLWKRCEWNKCIALHVSRPCTVDASLIFFLHKYI